MGATLYFFILSTCAFFLTAHAGTWDSFEMGYKYAGDDRKCFSNKHQMEMLMHSEYHVPNKCKTILCHDSYIISERTLEVGKKYDTIGACGTITCDASGNLEVEKCNVQEINDRSCKVSKGDLEKAYPNCCLYTTCVL